MTRIEMQIIAFALGAVTCTPSAFFYFIVVMCICFRNHTQDEKEGEKRNETSHEGLPGIRMMKIFRMPYTTKVPTETVSVETYLDLADGFASVEEEQELRHLPGNDE